MIRTEECDRCQRFSGSEFLVCAIHPSGPSQSHALILLKWHFLVAASKKIAGKIATGTSKSVLLLF
jgi:hypothetical protein